MRFPRYSKTQLRAMRRSRQNVFRPHLERLEDRLCLSVAYDFDVIAKTGDQGLVGLGNGPSINDSGKVAFVGRFADGSDSVFVGDSSTPAREFSSSLRNPSRTFRENVQINNKGKVVAVDRVSGSPASYSLRIWDAPDSSNVVQEVDPRDPTRTFDSFFDSQSINDDGQVTYIGKLAGASTVILNRDGEGISSLPSPQPNLRPMIADGGLVVARTDHDTAKPSQNPIKLFGSNPPATIIASAPQFSALGGSPGISDDGTVIVFYGERDENSDGVAEPGIFASIKTDQGRDLKRIAGVAGNGYRDPGETLDDNNQNGQIDPGEDKGPFTRLDGSTRVGVSVPSPDQITVVYVGYSATGAKGIYTSRLTSTNDANNSTFDVSDASLVVEIGKSITIAGQGVTLQDVAVYDPINQKGQIAFWATTTAGEQLVVRADPVRTPVLIVPGIAGTMPLQDRYEEWLFNRGVAPDILQIDPLARVYDDLIQSLKNAGYVEGKDLFVANYDWRLLPGPIDPVNLDGCPSTPLTGEPCIGDPSNDRFDGSIGGLSGTSITDTGFQFGVDYLGYWLKQAVEAWHAESRDMPLESVDVIAHSTGGLVTRAYIQSEAYGDTFSASFGTTSLPKIDNFIMVGVPNRGASKAWNPLNDNFVIDISYRLVLSKILNSAYQRVVRGQTINGPPGEVINRSSIMSATGTPDPKLFISQFVPTVRSLLATYDFLTDLGSAPTNVNDQPLVRNNLLLDLNAGLDRVPGGDPNAFAAAVGRVIDIFGTNFAPTFPDNVYGSGTPTFVIQRLGTEWDRPASGDIFSLNDKVFAREPLADETWFDDLGVQNNGDGTVPLESSRGQFVGDPRVELFPFDRGFGPIGNTLDGVGHTELLSNVDVQSLILSTLASPLKASQISTVLARTNRARILNLWLDPIEGGLVDGKGRRLGFTADTGILEEIPESIYFGGTDGIGWVFGPVEGPLELRLSGVGQDYFVQVSGMEPTKASEFEVSGVLGNGQTQTNSIPILKPLNEPPQLAAMADRELVAGELLTFTATASDINQDQLTFTLDAGAPTGASIDPTSGAFAWTPTLAQSPGSYDITVRVTDNGEPVQSSAQTFHVSVAPHISITDVSAREGNAGTTTFDFTVTLSAPSGQPVTLDFATANGTASADDSDFESNDGTLTFAPGGPLTQTINVRVNGDKKDEPDETFILNLSNVVNATVDKARGVGTIQNDDTTISIGDVTQREGDAGPSAFVFTISLSSPSVLPVTVDYATSDDTATRADRDYEPLSGTVSFEPGEITKTVSVNVNGDLKSEGNEFFFVSLINPVNAAISANGKRGLGTISDDDAGGTAYYVNDSSTVGDVFTAAPGDNANDGLTPEKPVASLLAVLSLYQMRAGDTIYVDTGAYSLARNVVLGPEASGVRIIGPGSSGVTPAVTADAVLADQPVAFWRLGDAAGAVAADATGHGITGVYTNGVALGENGMSDDGAAKFDGMDDYVSVPDSPELNPPQFSIEAWVNYQGAPDAIVSIVRKSANLRGDFGLGLWGGGFYFYVGSSYLHSLTKIQPGVWTHIVGTYDGSESKLYVNGTFLYSQGGYRPSSPTGFPLEIGSAERSDLDAWSGKIDEVAFYDKALTPARIQAHYAQLVRREAILDRGNTSTGSYVIELAGADNVTVSGLTLKGGAVGIYAATGANSLGLSVSDTDIYGNGQGIRLEKSNDGARVYHSSVHGSSQYQLQEGGIDIAAADATIRGNTVFGNRGVGIGTSGPRVTISDNAVFGNSGGGIRVNYGTRGLISGNDVYGNSGSSGALYAGAWGAPAPAVGADRLFVVGNKVHDNATDGISGYGGISVSVGVAGETEIVDNVVYGNGQRGIVLTGTSSTKRNTVYDNADGIVQVASYLAPGWDAKSVTVSGNRVFNNRNVGIRIIKTSTAESNVVYSNAIGILGERDASPAGPSCSLYANIPFAGKIANNVVYGNTERGIVVAGATSAEIANNTVYQPIGDAVVITANAGACTGYPTTNAKLRNNILWTEVGYDIYVANDSHQGFSSDYNVLYTTRLGKIAFWQTDITTLMDWSLEVGQDPHSLAADPKFLNPAGADGILGYNATAGVDGGRDDDFHLRNGSPAIDRGDPSFAYSNEPSPNGNRINIGAYGNSAEATTNAGASVQVRESNGITSLGEGGEIDTYTLVLTSQPTADVTIAVTPDSQIIVSPSVLTFTPTDWNGAQLVTVRALDDQRFERDHRGTITHTATSADQIYNGITIAGVTANITDNDAPIPGSYPWQNPKNRMDVNDDNFISPVGDVLPLINELNQRRIIDAVGNLPPPPVSVPGGSPIVPPPFYDTNGDNLLTPVGDVLPLINFLNPPAAEGESGKLPLYAIPDHQATGSTSSNLVNSNLLLAGTTVATVPLRSRNVPIATQDSQFWKDGASRFHRDQGTKSTRINASGEPKLEELFAGIVDFLAEDWSWL